MDAGENPNNAQKEPLTLGVVARRVGGVLANLVPNSRPIHRERSEELPEPRFSLDPGAGDAAWSSNPNPDSVLSLDVQRKKRGGETRDLDSPRQPLTDRQARNLDELRKKKSA